MDGLSKGSSMSSLLALIVSLGIVVFLFWYFYLKTPSPSANLPDNNKSTLENYQEVINSAKTSKCLTEAQNQQERIIVQYKILRNKNINYGQSIFKK